MVLRILAGKVSIGKGIHDLNYKFGGKRFGAHLLKAATDLKNEEKTELVFGDSIKKKNFLS